LCQERETLNQFRPCLFHRCDGCLAPMPRESDTPEPSRTDSPYSSPRNLFSLNNPERRWHKWDSAVASERLVCLFSTRGPMFPLQPSFVWSVWLEFMSFQPMLPSQTDNRRFLRSQLRRIGLGHPLGRDPWRTSRSVFLAASIACSTERRLYGACVSRSAVYQPLTRRSANYSGWLLTRPEFKFRDHELSRFAA
jgi:hypothetical protein